MGCDMKMIRNMKKVSLFIDVYSEFVKDIDTVVMINSLFVGC